MFYCLPTVNGQQTLFGISLKNDDFQTYGFPILKKYRRDLYAVAIAGGIRLELLYLTSHLSPNSLAVAYIFANAVIIFLLFKYLKQTWRFRDQRAVSRLAVPLNSRPLRDFSNSLIEIGIIILTISPFVELTIYYPLYRRKTRRRRLHHQLRASESYNLRRADSNAGFDYNSGFDFFEILIEI